MKQPCAIQVYKMRESTESYFRMSWFGRPTIATSLSNPYGYGSIKYMNLLKAEASSTKIQHNKIMDIF